MMTTGEEICWKNARVILRGIGMPHLVWLHGAVVNIVRRSLNVRDRPSYHQQALLEAEFPALLAYLEKLSASGDAAGWRALRDRVQLNAELLRESNLQQCSRPWLAAIWHTLPELAVIGQTILDGADEPRSVADFEVAPLSTDADANSGNGGDDEGSAGKSGSAGTAAKPKPARNAINRIVWILLIFLTFGCFLFDAPQAASNPRVARSCDVPRPDAAITPPRAAAVTRRAATKRRTAPPLI